MECKNILQVSRLKIGCFDTKFYGFNEIRTIDDLRNMDFIGRGGTDFNLKTTIFDKELSRIPHFDYIYKYISDNNLYDIIVEFALFDKEVGEKKEKVIVYELRTNY